MQISEEDNFPRNICEDCFVLISNTYTLQCKSKQSDEILKKTVESLYRVTVDTFLDDTQMDNGIFIVIPDGEDELIEKIFAPDELNENDEIEKVKVNNNDPQINNTEESMKNGIIREYTLEDDEYIKRDIGEVLKALNISELECTMCFKSFENKECLKAHEIQHGVNMRHVCKLCSKSYRKVSILRRHYITHTNEKKFICDICSKAFYHRNSLNAHMVYHTGKKFSCLPCNKSFYFKHTLKDHLNICEKVKLVNKENDQIITDDNIKIETPIDCTMCSETFTTEDELKEHKKIHPPGSRHYCKICDKSYLEATALRRHMIMHTDKKKYLCNTCGKSFFYRNVLKAHMVYHNEKKHACSKCDKKFHTPSILKQHIRLNHSVDRYNYICEECGKMCSSKSRLSAHISSHVKICCPFCGKSYKNRRYYKDHLKTHTGEGGAKKKFICDYCGEERNLKTLLEQHILSKHLNERRYKCKICDKGFYSNGTLQEHQIVHTGERPEQCDICRQRLVNKKALVLHYRRHTGEKPYPCNICGERFISSSRRRVHEKCRHGEKTEFCFICPAKFFLKSELNKHMTSHMMGSKKLKKAEKSSN